jgi:glycosyltransferase involved in cell wall biosynthesis
MDKKIPILFLSDAVSSTTGLGRITRDLAFHLSQHCQDVYDVAAVGYGGVGNQELPFMEYHVHDISNWLVPELPQVWEDWAQGREGILMVVWDMSRLYWLGTPQKCPIPHLRRFAERKDVKKWAYHAIDAEGPLGKLPSSIAETMKGFDRVLDYSEFSSRITGNKHWLPHGIDTQTFFPRDRRESRKCMIDGGFQGLNQDSLLLGVVATNQARKNWQLAFAVAHILMNRGHDVRLWCHTDVLERHWSLPNLIVDYGLLGRVAVTTQRYTDEQMSMMYAACNVTMGIGPEGAGYPIMESLACGVPCVTGKYAAQADYAPERMLVPPIAFHYEGGFCSKRPVFQPEDWADRVEVMMLEAKQTARKSLLPESLDWKNLWPRWEQWFREGVA